MTHPITHWNLCRHVQVCASLSHYSCMHLSQRSVFWSYSPMPCFLIMDTRDRPRKDRHLQSASIRILTQGLHNAEVVSQPGSVWDFWVFPDTKSWAISLHRTRTVLAALGISVPHLHLCTAKSQKLLIDSLNAHQHNTDILMRNRYPSESVKRSRHASFFITLK